MSFILDDKKLVQLLTTAGAQHINKFGQDPIGPDQSKMMDYSIANKLLVNLARTIAPNDPNTPKAASPVGIAGNDPNATVGIKPKDLRNLGDLLNWVSDSQITWNGKPFVWKTQQEAQASGEQPMPIDVMGVKRDRNTETRVPNRSTVYVSKQPLLEFLTMLRDSDEAKKDAVFRVMIGKSINQVNDFLEDDEKISRDPKGKGATTTLPDNFAVDGFPSNILDLSDMTVGTDKAPRFDGMNVKLTMGDLKDKGTLAQFLRNMKLKVNNKEQFVFDPKNPDPCTAVHILYRRAQYLGQIANDSEVKGYAQAVKTYQTQIVNIGRQFTMVDENGQEKPCQVTTPTTGPGQQPGQQPGGGGKGGNTQTGQLIHNVVQYMPLRAENFDFTRVQSFFRAYEALLAGSQSPALPAVQQLAGRIETAKLDLANVLINPAMYSFTLGGDAQQVVGWLKPPQFQNYIPFCRIMIAALEATKDAISMFYSAYADPKSTDKLDPDEAQIVAGQFTGSSFYQRNRWDMNRWVNTSDQVTGLKQ